MTRPARRPAPYLAGGRGFSGVTTTTPTITANITARGPRSTVPDNAGAVDATVYVDGRDVGDCTLLPRQYDGRLDVWGELDHWADDTLRAALDAGTLSADDVVEAVIAADRYGFVYIPGPRFCACGRVESDCDQSRASCPKAGA